MSIYEMPLPQLNCGSEGPFLTAVWPQDSTSDMKVDFRDALFRFKDTGGDF